MGNILCFGLRCEFSWAKMLLSLWSIKRFHLLIKDNFRRFLFHYTDLGILHWNRKVIRVTTLIFTEYVEGKLQTSSVNTKVVTLTTFPFLCSHSNWSWYCRSRVLAKVSEITSGRLVAAHRAAIGGFSDAWCKVLYIYRKVSNIRRTLVGNKIVDHSDVVGAAPSSFST